MVAESEDMEKKVEELKKLISSHLTEDERLAMNSSTLGNIICVLAKYLINTMGYSTASRIISKDIRELGKEDVKKYAKIFQNAVGEPKEYDSNFLRIAGMMLGLKIKLIKAEDGLDSLIVDCPFSASIKKFRDPFICNICAEYNKGMLEAFLGPDFKLETVKRLTDGDEYCYYKVRKRV